MSNPVALKQVDTSQSKWSILSELWEDNSVQFNKDQDGWRIREKINSTEVFSLRRDYLTQGRYTDTDLFGLLGLSLIDLTDKSVYITEGVSDFFTAKMLLRTNVLGVTQLGGSKLAKEILISLFNHVTIIADNDPAGLGNAMRWKTFLSKFGISTTLWQPSKGKDITDEFLFNYKIDTQVQI